MNIDLASSIQEFKKSLNKQPYNLVEYRQKLKQERDNQISETLFPNILRFIGQPVEGYAPMKNLQTDNHDQLNDFNNLNEYSDTLSLSFISDSQQQFNIQEIPSWFKDFTQYGYFFKQLSFYVDFIKMNTFHNILRNNFSIIIDQGYDTKLYSGFNRSKMDWVVIKEQIVSDNQLLIVAQQFIIHDHIYNLYPNQFLQLVKPIYIQELVDLNKFQFTSQLEYGKINLYNYSQQNKITEFEFKLIFQQIYQQIRLLHNHNIAHRDIKPQNIVYVENKGWLLCDFGDSLKYQDVNGIYDIKGTKAFLQQYLQLISHIQGISIKQNLFVNDIYALAITLIIIKYQIKQQDEIQHYINQPGDFIIESLILNPNQNNIESHFIKTEYPFIKIQLKENQNAFTPNAISIQDIFSLALIIKNYQILPCENQDEIQQKILSFLDQKLDDKKGQFYEQINIICYQIIPEQSRHLKNLNNYELYRQCKYWKKMFTNHNQIENRKFKILQIIFMDSIGLTDLVLYWARIFLLTDYDFTVHLIILKVLIQLEEWEQVNQEYNLITKYREFKEMTSKEIQLFQNLALRIVQWCEFQKDDIQFISEITVGYELITNSLLQDCKQDRQSLELLAIKILQIKQISFEKQFYIPYLFNFFEEVSKYLEISKFFEFLDIMKSKIKYFCTTYFWQINITCHVFVIMLLKQQYHMKIFLKEMNYVMIYNCESQQQYKFLQIQKLLTLMYQNIKTRAKEQKIFHQIYDILTQVSLITIKLYRVQIVNQVIFILCAYMEKNRKYLIYPCFRILILIWKRPNYLVELQQFVKSYLIATTSDCFRISGNFKRFRLLFKNGDMSLIIKNMMISQSERSRLETHFQMKLDLNVVQRQFLHSQYCFRI